MCADMIAPPVAMTSHHTSCTLMTNDSDQWDEVKLSVNLAL